MLVGVRVQVKPVAGEIEDVREIVPVKLFTGATVIVAVPAIPALIVRLVGAATTVKSSTLYVNVTVWESGPLVPVTVTV
jgi:hypothetical protein